MDKNDPKTSFIIEKLFSIFKTEILGKMSVLLREGWLIVVKQAFFVQCGQGSNETLVHLLKEKIKKQEI